MALTRESVLELLGDARGAQFAAFERPGGDPAEVGIRLLLDELEAADASVVEAQDGRQEFDTLLRTELKLEEAEAVIDGVRRLKALADLGSSMQEDLLERLVKAEVRAHGGEFDEDAYVANRRGWSPEQVRAEIERLEKAAPFVPGRVSAPEAPSTPEVVTPVLNPALYG
jgi:hypothetical protein